MAVAAQLASQQSHVVPLIVIEHPERLAVTDGAQLARPPPDVPPPELTEPASSPASSALASATGVGAGVDVPASDAGTAGSAMTT
jgi:hypothetical protein